MKTNDRRKAPLGQGGVGNSVGLVAFDADDTLWDCQGAFCAVEHALAKLLSPYAEADEVLRVLAATERRNMPLTGYGAKAFTLSMVEAAVGVSRGCVGGEEIDEVLRLGRRLMELPATPLPGVEATLRRVREVVSCPVVVFTKGELRDQEGKMDRSGLRRWFDDVVTVDHTLTTVKPLDKGQKLTILVAGNTISAPGATAITAYTLDGQVAAQSASTISALAKGLYIVKATDATGRQTTAKVMVK